MIELCQSLKLWQSCSIDFPSPLVFLSSLKFKIISYPGCPRLVFSQSPADNQREQTVTANSPNNNLILAKLFLCLGSWHTKQCSFNPFALVRGTRNNVHLIPLPWFVAHETMFIYLPWFVAHETMFI